MALSIAVISWILSVLISDAFDFSSWRFYVTLSLLDLCVLYCVGFVNIDKIRQRWMSCLLFISILMSSVSSIIFYVYQFFDIKLIDFTAMFIVDFYSYFSVSISALLVIVSLMSKVFLNVIDRNFWQP